MSQIRVLFPFKAGGNPGGVRNARFSPKNFITVNKELVKSEHIVAGLTMFEPGKVSAVVNLILYTTW